MRRPDRRKLGRVLRAVARTRDRGTLAAGPQWRAHVAGALAFAPDLPPVAFALAARWDIPAGVAPERCALALSDAAALVVNHGTPGGAWGRGAWRRRARRCATERATDLEARARAKLAGMAEAVEAPPSW